eukprot:TRINITY_DN1122_c0_g1_i3.p1 TRINITY_DN1122_c0_g1~~TRINITY_DN1122_c0_g1_i3.p1  ORF type:complete len:243 (-),score=44.70 TRINITY_DN1122_c0_g1_i3:119-775(-)
MSVKYVNQEEAKKLDEELMNEKSGFINEQLMELAGLSSACAIFECYPKEKYSNVLLIIGPGNNGGDGMVCARHLVHFGYNPILFYPRVKDQPPFKGLIKQCEHLKIPIHKNQPTLDPKEIHLIVDAIFGYSFTGEIRSPFDAIIKNVNDCKIPVFSIDIPSGWNVEKGNEEGKGLNADTLISLTVPKLGVKNFKGKHYLGGRFVPPYVCSCLFVSVIN